MGNEQSAPTPRRRPQNKLSKPRTNNHSNANLLDRRASAPASRRNSVSTNNGSPTKNRDSVAVDVLGDAIDAQKEAKPRKRMSLFRSKSAKPQSEKLDTEIVLGGSSVEPSPIEPSERQRWSRVRGHSMTSQSTLKLNEKPSWTEPAKALAKPPMRSRMSLQNYSHHPRLSLVAELPSPQPDKMIANRRLSRYGEDEGSPQGLTQASRTNSESALYTPIRRRSLLQHGVATRTSFGESDPRSSLPSQVHSLEITPPRSSAISHEVADDMRNYYYNPSKPTSSPLSDLVSLGPNPDFIGIGPRTETPTELEHIGAFKLGTLRIMNGAASPVPSIRSADEDYIAAGNARRSQESTRGPGQRSNTLSVPGETRKAPWIVRAESPLRQAHELENKPLKIETQLPLIDPSFAWFDFEGTEKLLKSTESPTKALELARDYQQDLALSPFSFENSPLPSPRVPSPKLESTSKHTAVEDDLFAAEPATPNLSERTPRSFDSAYDSGFAPPKRMLKGPRNLPPKPLAKADSGYSSNMSLRSFKRDSVATDEQNPTPPKEAPSRVASSTYSVASVTSSDSDLTLRMKRSLPSIPLPPMRKAPPAPLAPTFDINKEVPNPPTPDKDLRQTHLSILSKQVSRKSIPGLARSAREDSPANSELSTSSSSSSRWSRKSKLEKRPQSVQPPKPQPEPVFTVQAFRSPSEQYRIPPPSFEARQHLEERVETFPVASFPNTYPGHVGLRHSSSKETLGTIFSVGSAEVRDELNFARLQSALPPVPVQPSIPEHPVPQPEFNRRNTFQIGAQVPTSSSETAQRESRRGRRSYQMPKVRDKSLPRVRDRSLPRLPPVQPISNEDLELHLTSYSTVSSSLGKSTYEVAANTIPRPPSRAGPGSNERAKSLTAQFEADAATRFNVARHIEPEPQQQQQPMTRIRSYDSIGSGNRRSTHTRPPPAHANNSPWRETFQQQIAQSLPPHPSQSQLVEAEKRHSTASTSATKPKTRSPPPVSMTTRKSVPTTLSSQSLPTPPAQSQNQNQSQDQNGWTNTANTWKSHRQSAGETLLQTRKSMEHDLRSRKSVELRRPTPELHGRKSIDLQPRPQPQPPLQKQNSYDSIGAGRTQPKKWNVGVGYEDAHAYPSPLPRKAVQRQGQEYDHSFGTSSSSNKENLYHQPEAEYYSYNDEEISDKNLSSQLHQRKTSTSDMLVLDRFSGGLDYGFERGAGLVGSAGMGGKGGMGNGVRKSVAVAERWGVDLSDVPVILRRVRVEG